MTEKYAVVCLVPILFNVSGARNHKQATDHALSRAHAMSKQHGVLTRIPLALTCEKYDDGVDIVNTP